jgi:hypothetical protein
MQMSRQQRGDASSQAVGQHLLELGQRLHRCLFDSADRCARGDAQSDGNCDRLGVIEQQRWEPAPTAEPVTACQTALGFDRVAQCSELLDVAADCPWPDLEPLSEVLAGPLTSQLQQREQRQQPSGGLNHPAIA